MTSKVNHLGLRGSRDRRREVAPVARDLCHGENPCCPQEGHVPVPPVVVSNLVAFFENTSLHETNFLPNFPSTEQVARGYCCAAESGSNETECYDKNNNDETGSDLENNCDRSSINEDMTDSESNNECENNTDFFPLSQNRGGHVDDEDEDDDSFEHPSSPNCVPTLIFNKTKHPNEVKHSRKTRTEPSAHWTGSGARPKTDCSRPRKQNKTFQPQQSRDHSSHSKGRMHSAPQQQNKPPLLDVGHIRQNSRTGKLRTQRMQNDRRLEHKTAMNGNSTSKCDTGTKDKTPKHETQRCDAKSGRSESSSTSRKCKDEGDNTSHFIRVSIAEKGAPNQLKIEKFLKSKLGGDIVVTHVWKIPDGLRADVKVNDYQRAVKLVKELNSPKYPTMNAHLPKNDQPKKEIDIKKSITETWQKRERDVLLGHQEKVDKIVDEITDVRRRMQSNSLEEFESVEVLESKVIELEQQQEEYCRSVRALFSKLNDTSAVETEKHTELRKQFVRECHKFEVALPMYAERSKVLRAIRENKVTIVMAETGSGKSTQMTQYMYDEGLASNGMIVCTQPRKVAAVSLAEHVATEMYCDVGEEVGYKAGMKSRKGKKTKVIYMTDHSLLNECMRDRRLSAYSCVIIDEAHERSIFTDLLLGMVKECLLVRDDLKVVITSATIDPEIFVNYFPFECPVVKVPGRIFPVEVIWYEGEPIVDYLSQAVEKVSELCQEERQNGDVLVFLTSPQETEKACDLMRRKITLNNIKCLPLHGKLQPEDQKKVFDKMAPVRKVVFATNSAETSITIPGIKFVVDTGYVKEKTYDAKRNMSSLDVVLINQSSAEQRKGRAGRTEPGKCYRLYSENMFAEMRTSSPPEILRVHLGQALLALYELGIEDPLAFQFVESPPIHALQEAQKNLHQLGAVLDGKITELGQRMVKLPIEPRLAKLVFEGIDNRVGYEALIIASFATVSGSVYFRVGNDDEKNKADKLKATFGDKNGDLLSLLNVYKQWFAIAEMARTKWCVKNSINAKSMRIAADTVKEMLQTLRRDVRVELEQIFNDADDTSDILAKLIFGSFVANLCIFSGNERIGYNIARLHQCVHIHPSCCLKTEGITPEWIVYEQVLQTSRDFALNVTPVKHEWVEEYAKENSVHFDIEEMKARKISPVIIPDVGPHLMRVFRGPMYKTLKEFDSHLQTISGSSMVAVETDPGDIGGNIKIFIADEYHDVAEELVNPVLEKERQTLAKESYEVALDDNVNQTRAVIGKGGSCTYILTPEEHKTLFIKAQAETTLEEIQLMFSHFGDVEEVVKFYGKKANSIWGKVVFCDPTHAEKAAVETQGQLVEASKQILRPARPLVDPQKFEVQLDWCRRKLTGIGFITFDSLENRCNASLILPGRLVLPLKTGLNAQINFKNAKNNEEELFVGGLTQGATEEDLQILLDVSNCQGVTRIRLNRVKGFTTTPEEFNALKEQVNRILRPWAPSGYDIQGRVPLPGHPEFRMTVFFKDLDEGLRAIRHVHGVEEIGGEVLHAKAKLSTSMFVAAPVFDIVQREIEKTKLEAEEKFDITMNWKQTHRGSRYRIHIEGKHVESVQKTKLLLHSITEGDVIDCTRSDVLKRLFSQPARHFFKTLMSKKDAFIRNDLRDMTVVTYGSEKVKTEVKIEINNYLSSYESHSSLTIPLCCDEMPKGLLKELIKKYGITFQQLQVETGAEQIDLVMKVRGLRVYGSDDAKAKATSIVQGIADQMPQSENQDDNSLDCVVCWCPIEKGDLQRLEYCGHPYCKECGLNMVENAIETKSFPIVCAKDGCGSSLVRRDLTTFDKMRQNLLKKLRVAAVSALVQSEKNKYHYCPTADCPNVYRVTENGTKFSCESCQSNICTSCHVTYHMNMNCQEYKEYKSDLESGGDGVFRNWMEQDKENRRNCPKCATPIEKDGGCSHVMCAACKSHICWNCGKLFAGGGQCYDHQPYCTRVWRPSELNRHTLNRD